MFRKVNIVSHVNAQKAAGNLEKNPKSIFDLAY